MQTHVKTLGILHIVFGVLGLLIGISVFLLLGGIAGLVAITGSGSDAVVASPILGFLALVVLGFTLVLSLPGIIAGFGLLNMSPWARTVMLVLSALHLFNFPLGTALGAYGLWILISPEVTAAFESRARFA
ncbi:MAG: hypothetical protein H7039_17600 [Bryobacteraceae bacterium]|nr:hypothetical protein [Bryobacteraceae bacterium]